MIGREVDNTVQVALDEIERLARKRVAAAAQAIKSLTAQREEIQAQLASSGPDLLAQPWGVQRVNEVKRLASEIEYYQQRIKLCNTTEL